MANEEHLKILKQGVEQWNQWRLENAIRPDLSDANLSNADLSDADLSNANLGECRPEPLPTCMVLSWTVPT